MNNTAAFILKAERRKNFKDEFHKKNKYFSFPPTVLCSTVSGMARGRRLGRDPGHSGHYGGLVQHFEQHVDIPVGESLWRVTIERLDVLPAAGLGTPR